MPVFVDTNVLVYARDASEPAKQQRAAAWMQHLWSTRSGRLSYQVLQEFYVTVTQKLDPGMRNIDARSDVRRLMAWRPVQTDAETIETAWSLSDRYRLSFWDALTVAAAKAGGCDMLLTEDLQAGQVLDGVRVTDPFRTDPPAG